MCHKKFAFIFNDFLYIGLECHFDYFVSLFDITDTRNIKLIYIHIVFFL